MRYHYVDIARGVAIVLMVIGHDFIPTWLHRYIYSFHMPLFFIVSGMFYQRDRFGSFARLLRTRLYTLGVPFLFFSVISALCLYPAGMFYFPMILSGWDVYPLWFMPVLLVSELLFWPVSRLGQRRWLYIAAICALVAGGWGLLQLHKVVPYKMDVVPFATFFIGVGYGLRGWIHRLDCGWTWVVAMGVVQAALSQLLPLTDMAANQYGTVALNLPNAVLGTLFVFMLSKKLDWRIDPASWLRRIRPLVATIEYYGRNSLYVMAFSGIFSYWLAQVLFVGCHDFATAAIRFVIVFAAIYVVSMLLSRYVPFLVGRRRPTPAR